MTDYDVDDWEAGLELDDYEPAPVEQPPDDLEYEIAPNLDGGGLVNAAAAILNSPEAQFYLEQYAAAEADATRMAAVPAIHSHIDMVEAKLGTTLDRRVVIERAEEILPDLIREYGNEIETGEMALQIAARENAGKATYDDIINRFSARAKK